VKMMKRLIVGAMLCGLFAGAAIADEDYLNRYDTAGRWRALDRLASGYTDIQINQYNDMDETDTIYVAAADTATSVWWEGGAERKGIDVIRYDSLHVAQWCVHAPKFVNTVDGPCTLFVWCGGDIGVADTDSTFPGSSDMLIFPMDGDMSLAVSGVPSPWCFPLSVDSVLICPADSMTFLNFYAIGDDFDQ